MLHILEVKNVRERFVMQKEIPRKANDNSGWLLLLLLLVACFSTPLVNNHSLAMKPGVGALEEVP